MNSFPLFLDACCLINLYATGRLRDIAWHSPYAFWVADYVLKQEAVIYRRSEAASASVEKIPIDLSPLLDEGLIQAMALENPEWESTYVYIAQFVDDGEAITGALAFHCGASIATDDKKARRVLREIVPSVPQVSTLDLLKQWMDAASVSDIAMREALIAIKTNANYVPSPRDPLYSWWQHTMGSKEQD